MDSAIAAAVTRRLFFMREGGDSWAAAAKAFNLAISSSRSTSSGGARATISDPAIVSSLENCF